MLKMKAANSRIYVISVILGIVIICLIVFYMNITIVPRHCDRDIECYGIIDVYLCHSYEEVIYAGDVYSEEETHGDSLVQFSNDKNYEGIVYYYPAVDENGKTTSESILKGLRWMEENNITKVNISMSTKFYSQELEEWIREHSDIQIYCSYNNIVNSYDYPAAYENVIASGTSDNIQCKDGDQIYHSNKIIIFNKGIQFYKGNSYLSLNSLLNGY